MKVSSNLYRKQESLLKALGIIPDEFKLKRITPDTFSWKFNEEKERIILDQDILTYLEKELNEGRLNSDIENAYNDGTLRLKIYAETTYEDIRGVTTDIRVGTFFDGDKALQSVFFIDRYPIEYRLYIQMLDVGRLTKSKFNKRSYAYHSNYFRATHKS